MNRLWVRLSLAFLIVAWTAIAALALIVDNTTERSFRQYLSQRNAESFSDDAVAALEQFYADNGTWTGAESLLPGPGQGQGGQGQGHGQGSEGEGGGTQSRRGGATVLVADAAGIVAIATDADAIGTALEQATLDNARALVVDGQTVGYLAQLTPSAQALGNAEERFLAEANRWLILAAIGASLLAVLVGGLLAWQLTRPLRALTGTAHALAAGQLGRQVEVRGAAEITDLARAFNRMSHDLAEGEALRQRMAADMAHELRTPVSVLRGHLEAMLDGMFPLDAEHLAVAYDRTIHLTRLVDDLRLLTRAEAGQLPLERQRIAAGTLVRRALESFAPLLLDAGITLRDELSDVLPDVEVDIDRMQQVLGNLLANALRHTPEGGTITVRAQPVNGRVRIAVSNTGKGLTREEAAQVFTPFWRAEEARERDKGGSGLGLAISQQLVMLHGGRMWAASATDGATFAFELPAADRPRTRA